MQDPEQFRAITSLDLTSKAKDPKTVYAEIVIEQWWDPNSVQRIAEAARNETMACFWDEVATEARRWLRTAFASSRRQTLREQQS